MRKQQEGRKTQRENFRLSQKNPSYEKTQRQLVESELQEGKVHSYKPSKSKLICLHLNQMADHMRPWSTD